ncbi:unnamed protein product [Prorocentrum cordatum]|uniref:Uncharacterized protein n=1 Tax=Prorocentrum cordatum TaxID=2364126 RepID=A0ABN9PD53_9DINO|nr:unnamed protein product [Polarella glacialis]
MPPHLPGQNGVLWNEGRVVGRSLLVLLAFLFVSGCLFMAALYPHLPMLVFIVMGMGVHVSIRWLTMPNMRGRASGRVQDLRVESQWNSLQRLIRKSDDTLKFYKAFAIACMLSSAAVTAAWTIQLLRGRLCFSDCGAQLTVIGDSCPEESDGLESGPTVFLAMSPLFVAFADLVFGLFALIRVVLNSTYLSTSRYRNQLASALRADPEALQRSGKVLVPAEVRSQLGPTGGGLGVNDDGRDCTVEVADEFQRLEHRGYQQLTMLVKSVGVTFVVLIGLGYAGALLVWADNEMASIFVSLLIVFFASFVLMTAASFSRIAHVLGDGLAHLPLWGRVLPLLNNDWVQAFLLCLSLPLISAFAALSVANQQVRRVRGISGFVHQGAVASRVSSTTDPADLATPADVSACRAFLSDVFQLLHPSGTQIESPLRPWLTARVHGAWLKVRGFRWLSIYTKVYVWCLVPFAYYVGSLLFSAGFAFLRHVLTPISFGLIIVLTFVVGVCAFLWPTVPGMVVYMFGGLLIPDTCTVPSSGGDEARFWAGVCINIVLCFFLKLSACAVQQKVIGSRLGQNVRVRQICGVHTPEMRTVESVLRKPGLSIGKVAILCGGPDWPVSVLCGILDLSLLQCELGTTPILIYIIPCSLCGSMYLRASDGAEWEAAASAMVFATTFMTGLLLVVMAWAVQKEWEQKGEDLGRPLRQHADLWFLDHKADTLRQRCTVTWNELPRTLRNCFALGALAQILVSHCFFWAYYHLFGDFTVSQPWGTIQWYAGTIDQCGCYTPSGTADRSHCVFASAGIALTLSYAAAWLPYKALYRHWGRRNAKFKEVIDQEFDEEYQRRWTDAFFTAPGARGRARRRPRPPRS